MSIKHLKGRPWVQLFVNFVWNKEFITYMSRFLMIILMFGSLVFFAVKCKGKASKAINEHEVEATKDGRIVKIYDYDGVFIYMVKGHEYICNVNGGIVHSETCPCKTK